MKQKEKSKNNLKGGLVEIVSLIVFAALAIGIWVIFGMNPWNLPFGTLALIGAAITALTIAAVVILLRISGKKRDDKK